MVTIIILALLIYGIFQFTKYLMGATVNHAQSHIAGSWGCSYSSVKRGSPFRWAFSAMLTQALPGPRSPPAVRLRTEPCPS